MWWLPLYFVLGGLYCRLWYSYLYVLLCYSLCRLITANIVITTPPHPNIVGTCVTVILLKALVLGALTLNPRNGLLSGFGAGSS